MLEWFKVLRPRSERQKVIDSIEYVWVGRGGQHGSKVTHCNTASQKHGSIYTTMQSSAPYSALRQDSTAAQYGSASAQYSSGGLRGWVRVGDGKVIKVAGRLSHY
jgi:hypothetical protein